MERWLSGRKRHGANVLGMKVPRGFESHSLRQVLHSAKLKGIACRVQISFWGFRQRMFEHQSKNTGLNILKNQKSEFARQHGGRPLK